MTLLTNGEEPEFSERTRRLLDAYGIDIRTERVTLDNPEAILLRRDGTLLVADDHNRKIRMLRTDGQAELFAGATDLKTAYTQAAEQGQ